MLHTNDSSISPKRERNLKPESDDEEVEDLLECESPKPQAKVINEKGSRVRKMTLSQIQLK